MFFKKQKNKSGFTLVEILIVIAIIGILATIAVIAMLSARVKANDTKRVYDVSQIKKALDLYYFEVGKYPNESEIEVDGYLAGEIALPGESNQIYMHQIPTAPKADGDCTDLQNKYDYVKLRDNCAIVSNCTAENGPTVISVGDCSVTMASEGIGGGWIIDLGGDETITIGASGGSGGAGGSGTGGSLIECIINSDCVSGEICSSGHCLNCDDGNDCTTEIIRDGVCINEALNGISCAGGTCNAGVCNECVVASDCNDDNSCTTDSCTTGACNYAPINFNDGAFCNGIETCADGISVAGTSPCSVSEICDEATDRCVECISYSDCVEGEFCSAGSCVSCDDDGNDCTTYVAGEGGCTNVNKSAGTPCSLGYCSTTGTCTPPVRCQDYVNSNLTLYNDINCTSGIGLIVNRGDITIDCNGHTLKCTGSACSTSSTGINIANQNYVRIKNCTINGFRVGIELRDSAGNGDDRFGDGEISNSTIINSFLRGLWVHNSRLYSVHNNRICSSVEKDVYLGGSASLTHHNVGLENTCNSAVDYSSGVLNSVICNHLCL